MRLVWFRSSAPALALAALGWAGCATAPQPMVDPGYAARAYAPARIAVLPPDVFVVVDQVGDNDPAQSAALGQAVSGETLRGVEQALRSRGYDVDLSARWDGIFGRDGSLLVSRDELGALANGVVSFANSPAGGASGSSGPMAMPLLIAPELAAKVGWATQSDALLYLNVKGAVTTSGKRAASIIAGVFIVFVAVAIVLAIAASQKGGGGGPGPGFGGGGGHGAPVPRATSAGGWHGTPAGGGGAWHGTPPGAGAGGWRSTPPGGGAPLAAPSARAAGGGGWRGSGAPTPAPRGAPVYRGGGGGIGIGIGVVVPLDGPVCTHEGGVDYDDPLFAGDELYVSMTLISSYDGRVLWHARDHLDLEADQPADIDQMVHAFLDALPPAGQPPR